MRALLVLIALAWSLSSSACTHRAPNPSRPLDQRYTPVGNRPDNAAKATPPADLATTALKLGAKAPPITLRDQAGQPWSIALAARGHKHLVLVFYRGDWCPYCRAQLVELQAHADDFAQRDAVVAVVSVDGPDTGAHLATGLALSYTVVSDPGHKLIGAFGVFDAETELAWPAIFVVDADGAIDWRWVADDFKQRVATLDVIGALAGERDAAAPTPSPASPPR
jgi:peroxiredoxin